MQICRTGHLVATAVAVLAMAACTGNDPVDAGSAPLRTPSTEAPEPTGEPDGQAAPTTTDVTPPATEPGRQEGSGGAPPGAGAGLPFVADTRPDTSSTTAGFPVLVTVAKGDHQGYVRYVFDFDDKRPDGQRGQAVRPAWDVRYVLRSEVVQDGSGFPVSVEGAAVLRIAFQHAWMHWEDGTVSLRHSRGAYDRLRFGGDFEGYVTWFLGVDGEHPFRAFSTDGDKVVIDVVTP